MAWACPGLGVAGSGFGAAHRAAYSVSLGLVADPQSLTPSRPCRALRALRALLALGSAPLRGEGAHDLAAARVGLLGLENHRRTPAPVF